MTKAQDAYKEAQNRIAQIGDSRFLDLRVKDLEVIPPEIATPTNLTKLDLGDTRITSVEPLTTLTNLTVLDLRGTQITSVEPLTTLSNLTVLHLGGTLITSVEPLTTLSNLTLLDLRGTQITSVEPLTTLSNLNALFLSGTQISDLRPIKNLTKLITGKSFFGLDLKNCAATKLDPELKTLSEIKNEEERTRKTLDYLNQLTEWPPAAAMPEENLDAPRYIVPDDGPITQSGVPLGANDPEQQALQDECREKVRKLIDTVRVGDNELASLVDAAKKYRGMIDKDPSYIFASSLWSAANTLRSKHEAHRNATDQGRLNEELPPLTASALQDLLQTHGIFFLGHPGAAEVERKMREFQDGPRNPEAKKAADAIIRALKDSPLVLAPESAEPLALDQQASDGSGPSAKMAEVSAQNRLQNFIGAFARKVFIFSGAITVSVIGNAVSPAVLSWFAEHKLLIANFYTKAMSEIPIWFDYIMQLITKVPM